jgi:predicted DNA-binding transcriptional regulator AlpA
MKSYSVAEWCALHGFSRSFFYKLNAAGQAPRYFKAGAAVRITEAAAAEWIAAREAAAVAA